MIFGLSLHAFTELHVVISLIGIVLGILVLIAMIGADRPSRWTGLFFLATLLTSVTGFFFPRVTITPAQIVGLVSLAVLAVALLGYYVFRLRGAWRWIYVVAALFALWLNVFVGVVQSFQKFAPLHALAPNGNEPAFMAAQGVVLLIFVVLGFLAIRRFHPERTLSA